MLTASNLDELIAPGALAVPGTVSARITNMRDARPCGPAARPCRGGLPRSENAPDEGTIEVRPVDLGNANASYAELTIEAGFEPPLRARLIEPAGAGCGQARAPVVLMFNDAGRPVRGWHHMTRFIAAGCAVLALDDGVVAVEDAAQGLARLAGRALALARAVDGLSGVDPGRVYAWGEGLGGALALLVTANGAVAVRRCAVCNPFPLYAEAPQLGGSIIDAAAGITAELLIGTGLRDEIAASEDCALLAHATSGDAELVVYPEHAHERINRFEDRVLGFFAQPASERVCTYWRAGQSRPA